MLSTPMRYLFGDSAPFPLTYNFLATLDTFVTCAARAVGRQVEILSTREQLEAEASARRRAADELEAFHRVAIRPLQEAAAARRTEPLIAEYVAQLLAQAGHLVEGARARAQGDADREVANAAGEAERLRVEIRGELEAALKAVRLPVRGANYSLTLTEGRNDVSVVLAHPDAITAAFSLAAANVPAWGAPRRVAEFAQGLEVQVGLRKTWLKRTMQPEVVHLDEFVISACEFDDDDFTLRLRRRADQRDALVLSLHRRDTELLGEVQRPEGDDGHELSPAAPMELGDREQLERLWQLLRAGMTELLPHKDKLLAVQLEGQDVVEQDLVLDLVARIVRHLAPTVAEIARRSPNPDELSLKHEVESGRREEVYLRRADLSNKLTSLPVRALGVFAPLRLGTDTGNLANAVAAVLASPVGARASSPPPAAARVEETIADADIVLDES